MPQFTPVKKVTRDFQPVRKTEISTITGKPIRTGLEEESVLKPIGEDLAENWPRYAGATVGGLAGVPGGAPGMIGGAAIGGAAGESYKQLGQHLGDPEAAPQTSEEAVRRISVAGMKSAGEEAFGIGAGKVIGKVLAPFKKTVTEEARAAYQTLEKYMPTKRPPLMPAEMTEHRGLDTLHTIAESSLFGSQAVAKYRNITRKAAIEDMVDDLADSFGARVDADVLGETVVDLVQGRFKRFKQSVTAPLYNKAEQLASGTVIDIAPIKKAFADHEFMKFGGKNAGDDFVRALNDLPDKVDFGVAKELRSRLLDEVTEFSVANPGAKAVRVGQKMRNMLDDTINNELKRSAPEALEAWRAANKLYKKGAERYNNRFLRRLIKKSEDEPERVLNMIFKNGGVKGLKRTRFAVGEQAWGQLKGAYLRDLLNKSTNMETGTPTGKILLRRLYGKTGGMGQEGLAQIFTKRELDSVRNVATALKVAQARQPGSGGMLIQLLQAGAAGGLMMGNFDKAAGVLLLGPYALSKIMLNPMASRWLSTGLKAPKLTPNVISAMTRLSTLADRLGKEEQEKTNGRNNGSSR